MTSRLFKGWIALVQLAFQILICWTVIYLVDSAIQRLNNRGQVSKQMFTVHGKDYADNGARHGGGVLTTTKKGIIASIWEYQDLHSELFFVDIITDGNKKLTIGTFYRPPNSDLKPLEDLRTCLSSITNSDLLIAATST